MDKSPIVSIVMPVYNGVATISRALESVLYQTYENWRCIIVNDGSTDDTLDILAKYSTDERFKIINLEKNRGRGNARQVALEHTSGDFLAFLDADDFYHPKKIETQLKAFAENDNLILCSSGVASFDKNGEIRIKRKAKKPGLYNFTSNTYVFPALPATCMLKLSVAKKNVYNVNLDVGEDNDFLHKCLYPTGEYRILPDVLYYYEEIGVVSREKFLYYQKSSIRKFSDLKIPMRRKMQLIISKLIKLVIYFFGIPFLGVDYFILKRGVDLSESEVSDYNELINFFSDNAK